MLKFDDEKFWYIINTIMLFW